MHYSTAEGKKYFMKILLQVCRKMRGKTGLRKYGGLPECIR